MRILDLLDARSVKLNGTAVDKSDVLNQMVDLMAASGKVCNRENYLQAVFAREEEGSTGVGEGIAIPHGRCKGVTEPGLAAMTLPAGVEYGALDDEPVDLVFLIAALEGAGSVHIDILSKLSMMLMDAETEKDMADAEKEEKAKVTDLVADRAKAEQKLGCLVKVETRGSGGAKNVLTEEEIEAADGIIVAADTNVPMDRF